MAIVLDILREYGLLSQHLELSALETKRQRDKETTVGEIRKVVVDFMEANSEKLQVEKFNVVVSALVDYYYCPDQLEK